MYLIERLFRRDSIFLYDSMRMARYNNVAYYFCLVGGITIYY